MAETGLNGGQRRDRVSIVCTERLNQTRWLSKAPKWESPCELVLAADDAGDGEMTMVMMMMMMAVFVGFSQIAQG